ncbi:MAG: hypothetical protein Q7J07_03320 [Pelolinea sp.]|nr:hypothetical protein [Pelolinea sp.]
MMIVNGRKVTRFNIPTTQSQKEYAEKQAAKLGIPVSEFVRGLIDAHKQSSKNDELRRAAEFLAADYKNNKEMTVFSDIDGDDFL